MVTGGHLVSELFLHPGGETSHRSLFWAGLTSREEGFKTARATPALCPAVSTRSAKAAHIRNRASAWRGE